MVLLLLHCSHLFNSHKYFLIYQQKGCGDPGPVANAQRTQVTNFNTGGFVTYTCNPGFTVQGRTPATNVATITCQNGQWTARPSCVATSPVPTGNSHKEDYF